MIQLHNNSTAKVLDLAKEALDAFCDDLSTMFEVEIACSLKDSGADPPQTLKKHFKKLGVVHTVKAEGSISGEFPLLFDQGGLFILAGVIVMLPEARIKEEAKRGSEKDAESVADAVGEVGNLLVGTWDRVFREELEGHKHFSKAGTYVGPLWDETEGKIGIPEDQECDYAIYELTVDNYPSFVCGVLLGTSAAESPSVADDTAAPEVEEEAAASESQPEPTEEDASAPEVASDAESESEGETQAETDESETPEPVTDTPPAEPEDQDTTSRDHSDDTVNEPEGEPASEPQAPEPSSESEEPAVTMAIPIPAPQGSEPNAALNLTARDILDPHVVWATAEENVQQVLDLMQQHDVGYVLVGDHGRLEGIVSKSNIMGALSPYLRPVFAKWRRPADDATLNIKIKWFMSRPVRTVGPQATLAVMMEQMCQFGGRCLPVTESSGKVIGVVTVFELLRALNASSGHHFVGRTPQAPCLLV